MPRSNAAALLKSLEQLPAPTVALDKARARELGTSTHPQEAFDTAYYALLAELQAKKPDVGVVDALIDVLEHCTAVPGLLSAAFPDKGIYFPSGSNRVGEIRGLASIGRPVGVAAPEIHAAAEKELLSLKGRNIPVFIDSGAFGEVKINVPHQHKGGKCLDKVCVGEGKLPFPKKAIGEAVPYRPITHEMWLDIFALYKRLGRALGSSLYVVAPDQVGDQPNTLARLQKYSPQLRELREMGVNIIVAIQQGVHATLSPESFDKRAEKALGFQDYIRGIPSKKAGMTVPELSKFVRYLRGHLPLVRVHLLGRGLPYLKESQSTRKIHTAYLQALVGCSVTADSVRILAICAKGRPLYEAKRAVARERKIVKFDNPEDLAEAVRRAFLADPRGASSVFEFSRVGPLIRAKQCKLSANQSDDPLLFLEP